MTLNARFRSAISKMPGYVAELQSSELIAMRTTTERRALRKKLPGNEGVYVLYENSEPVYVGRSDRLADRLLEHGRPSSESESASFAFNMAKRAFREQASGQGLDTEAISREDLQAIPEFQRLFTAAKECVTGMRVRAVSVPDPIEQAILEVYAHLDLDTDPEFNSFENH